MAIGGKTYLFIEEALYLMERKIIHVTIPISLKCPHPMSSSDGCGTADLPTPPTAQTYASLPDMFSLLPASHVSIPSYIAYSTLRSQTYVPLRSPGDMSWGDIHKSNRKATIDTAQLPPPPICISPHPTETPGFSTMDDPVPAYNVYAPSSTFKKSSPPPPDFTLYVTPYLSGGEPGPPADFMWMLDDDAKVCVVGDSGDVVMYSIGGNGIPCISKNDVKKDETPKCIKSGDIEAVITPYGATLMSLKYCGVDVVLGFDSLDEYKADDCYIGSTVGRVCNRIAGGELSFEHPVTKDKVRRVLAKNNGENHLHGGENGFDDRVWTVEELTDSSVSLALISPDGDQNYPGEVRSVVTYSLVDSGLTISFESRLTESSCLAGHSSPINLTNHSYFNLSGRSSDSCLSHTVQLQTKGYFPTDDSIPTRDIVGDDDGYEGNKGMDFRRSRTVGSAVAEISGLDPNDLAKKVEGGKYDELGHEGVDHCYIAGRGGATLDLAVPRLGNPVSKIKAMSFATVSAGNIKLTASTTYPGFQFYTGNYLPKRYQGFALEAQYYPDSIGHIDDHHKDFKGGACKILSGDDFDLQAVRYSFETIR